MLRLGSDDHRLLELLGNQVLLIASFITSSGIGLAHQVDPFRPIAFYELRRRADI